MADSKNTQTEKIYQLKIRLEGSKPPIWRRVEVKGSISLATLHEVIQCVMGWEDDHLHRFTIGDEYFGQPEPSFAWDVQDESRFKLCDLVSEKDSFLYVYDFGDSWHHKITVEKVSEAETGVSCPRCLTGRRNSPLEDVGGVWGYMELLDTIKNSNHPEHESMKNWMREVYGIDQYDPAAFNLEEINLQLRMIR